MVVKEIDEFSKRVFQQTMDIWVIPEINKRRIIGKLPTNFELRAAQIIFSLDQGFTKVRLNDEIKAVANCIANATIEKGQIVKEQDIERITSIELTEKDPNCAHITLLSLKGKWHISFDFRYNKRRVNEHIEASKEFLETAKDALLKNRIRAFFENAFASAELSAKAILLQLPDKKILLGKNHRSRIESLQSWAELGNTKIEYATTLSKLCSLRSSARYLSSADFKKENTNKIFKILEELLQFAQDSAKESFL